MTQTCVNWLDEEGNNGFGHLLTLLSIHQPATVSTVQQR
jgi:hypothetical protein